MREKRRSSKPAENQKSGPVEIFKSWYQEDGDGMQFKDLKEAWMNEELP